MLLHSSLALFSDIFLWHFSLGFCPVLESARMRSASIGLWRKDTTNPSAALRQFLLWGLIAAIQKMQIIDLALPFGGQSRNDQRHSSPNIGGEKPRPFQFSPP